MPLALLAILAGIVLLVLAANFFVDGASALAKHFNVPPLLIGIIVIGMGTSMPELIVSATAAYRGTSGIALGNAFGSNIVNIGLILGVCTLINPINVTRIVISREIPILIVVTAIAIFLLKDGELSRLDAVICLLVFAISVYITIKSAKQEAASQDPVAQEIVREADEQAELTKEKITPPSKALVFILGGLAVMIGSSELLVWGAVEVAKHFGVSDLVIGLTIVSVGTGLPELASSVIAARKGHDDLAIGNVIGSNTFNSLVVPGIAGLIHPLQANHDFLHRDLPVVAAGTLLLYIFSWGRNGKGNLIRPEGACLLVFFAAYTGYLLVTGG